MTNQQQNSLFQGDYATRFGDGNSVSLNNKNIVKSVSDNQAEILRSIMMLYCPNGFDLDPTYSTGNFYKNIKEPKIKLDLNPNRPDTIKADATKLPIKSNSINSIMFDPPFVGASRKDGKPGVIKERFSYYKNVQFDLWGMYWLAINEFRRVLKPKGYLIFKCQDVVESGKQYMTHVQVMNYAVRMGFYPKDLFILIQSNRILNQKTQEHARKYHSYFWVFIKRRSEVLYN